MHIFSGTTDHLEESMWRKSVLQRHKYKRHGKQARVEADDTNAVIAKEEKRSGEGSRKPNERLRDTEKNENALWIPAHTSINNASCYETARWLRQPTTVFSI
ncbi:hypothetical protein TRVL_00461 [Trypanosoma vivax]|nr:hypothetical protein TRVL_00461 [Trypanosoma vivax]